MDFLLRPLTFFHKEFNDGDNLFKYLYYRRNGLEDHVLGAIRDGINMTIVGGAGLGKTSLMHYLYIEIKDDERMFPIFLDYRVTAPDGDAPFLVLFVKGLRKYFGAIGHSLDEIAERTTIGNVYDHLASCTSHLDGIKSEELSKKIVIFLDDLDYAEEYYIALLNKYFLPYAMSEKVILILSVRPPLLNHIQSMDELCQYYYVRPRAVELAKGDVRYLLIHRLKSLLTQDRSRGGILVDRMLCFLRIASLDTRLRVLMNSRGIEMEEETLEEFPFEASFYSDLEDVTCSNLRDVEHVFPLMCGYEFDGKSPSLNTDFYEAFIQIARDDPNLLLDLVSEKEKGNSMLQNVLEYFYFETHHGEDLYRSMEEYGIGREKVESAIQQMVRTPYMLLVPRDIYDNEKRPLSKQYDITRKGIVYVERILRSDAYYTISRGGEQFSRSKASYYEQREAAER